ncbi:MAG: glycosyltransferase family 1 protein [Caulobacteraceae bacterium]|nr:glycosyltransferase family 1 protein [Caulobacteraceae bacterium]
MARIVLSTAGTAGDLNPFVAIALELKARGHEPCITAQREFQATIEGEGVEFHPLRPGVADVREELGLEAPEIVQRATRGSIGLEFAVRRIAMPFLKRSFDDMMAATAGADLVITHTSAFAGRLAAETRGLPWVSAALSPFTFMSAYDPPILSAMPALKVLREMTGARSDATLLKIVKALSVLWTGTFQSLRAELGLPRCANPLFEGQFSRLGSLALYSSLFGAAQPDFPTACTLTGFCFYDRQHGAPTCLPDDLKRFLAAGAPPLVFTLGSTLVMDPGDFYNISVTAARSVGQRAVLLVGPGKAEALLARGVADDVHIADYAPHSALFPHASAIIHHGGIGTTAQAMRAGKPQLVVPHFGDQPDNANRIERLGVGRMISPGGYTPIRAARELAVVLDSRHQARTAEIAVELGQEDGVRAAADAIEAAMTSAGWKLSA